MADQVLYLLRHANEPRFKIGISADPHARIGQLADDIDRDSSLCIYSKGGPARQVESMLHLLFRQHRVDVPEKGNGHTEWFSMACMPDVLSFLRANADRIGCSDPISLARFNLAVDAENLVAQESGLQRMVHLVLQAVGRVGKTTIAGLLADSLERTGSRVIRWDSDPISRAFSNQRPNVERAYSRWASAGEHEPEAADEVFNACSNEKANCHYVVDWGTTVFLNLISVADGTDYESAFKSIGLNVVAHVPICGSDAQIPTLKGLDAIRQYFSNIVVWKNQHWGGVEAPTWCTKSITLPSFTSQECLAEFVPHPPRNRVSNDFILLRESLDKIIGGSRLWV